MNESLAGESRNLVARAWEPAVVAVLFLAIFAGQALITRSGNLFSHCFWLDEILTWTITNDPSFGHAISALRDGVDTNPPTLYLILWPLARLTGGLNELGLRTISFISIILALMGIYAICRRYLSPMPSFIGAMTVAAHPLVIQHAFDARSYGPWLAATIWYAQTLQQMRHRFSLRIMILACVLAILAATLHYFGVIGVILVSLADLIVDASPRRSRRQRLIPPALGIAAWIGCIPFILGQRNDLQVETWIAPASLSDLRTMFAGLWGAPAILFVILAAWIWRVTQPGTANRPSSAGNLRGLAPITSLLLFPLAIFGFSLLVQPAMLDRYLIVAVAPVGALAAYVASEKPRWFCGLLLAGLVVIGGAEVNSRAQAMRKMDDGFREIADSIGGQTVVFKRRLEMFPMIRLRPEILPHSAMLDFDPIFDSRMRTFSVFERDMARKFARNYPFLKLIQPGELSKESQILVVTFPDSAEWRELEMLFPGWRATADGTWMVQLAPRQYGPP